MLDATRPLFETDPGGGGEPGPAPPEPEPQPEGDPEGAWTGPPQEEWERTQEILGGLEPLANLAREGLPELPGQYGFDQYAGGFSQDSLARQPNEPPPPPDPAIDPQGFARWMDDRDQQREQALMERMQPVIQDYAGTRAQSMLDQAMGTLPNELRGLGLPDEHAELAERAIANISGAYFDERTPLPQVIQQGAQELSELLAVAKAQGRDEYIASLQGGDGGGGRGDGPAHEPPVGGGGLEGVPLPKSYDEIIARHLSPR